MHTSKLHDFLQRLAPRERRDFRDFVASPYFNRNDDLVRLNALMEDKVLERKAPGLTEEAAWEALFPGTPFDKNKFRKMKSALQQLLLEFLAFQDFRRDKPRMKWRLLRQLNILQEDRYFSGHYAEARKALDETPVGRTDFAARIAIALEGYAYELRQPPRRPNGAIGEALDTLEEASRFELLRFAYLGRNQRLITGVGPERDRTDAVVRAIREAADGLPPAARMYLALHKGLDDPDDTASYRELRGLLHSLEGRLDPSLLVEGYTGALNFCARRLNRNDAHYLGEMLALYREMLDAGLLLEHGRLLAPHFKNIVSVAARSGEFEWTRRFIAEYRDRLYGDYLENALQYNLGVLAYWEGELAAAERHFNAVLAAFEDIFYGIDARVYLLRVFYETGDVTGLDALCDSFRMYLKRRKDLPRGRKASYQEFIRLIRRLSRTPPHDRDRLERLREAIANGRGTGATGWLLKKVNALLSGK